MDVFDSIIVGSGAGGATLAKSLTEKGMKTLVLERGKVERVGNIQDCLRFYDLQGFLKGVRKSKQGVAIWQSYMAGGSTVISCGNIARCLESEIVGFGIDLSKHFDTCEAEINPMPISEDLLGMRSIRIRNASHKLGYQMDLMPKGINPIKCTKCGKCVFGCKYGAKWSSLSELYSAKNNGCSVRYNSTVNRVLHRDGKVTGVLLECGEVINSNIVIVSAGGINTPIILQRSGIEEAGRNLFCDLLINVYGTTDENIDDNEPVMALMNHEFYQSHGIIIAPYIAYNPLYRYNDGGMRTMFKNPKRTIGMMVKIRDENQGTVHIDGTISKAVSPLDHEKISYGVEICKKILKEAGAKERFVLSKIQGAHPGGSCAIGKVVNSNLETSIRGLFVSDASILPVSPGFPPILTIMALSKYLASHITK